MKRTLTLSCIVLTYFISTISSAETLQHVVAHTIKTNPQIAAASKFRQATAIGVRQAESGYLPSLDVSAGYGREHTENVSTSDDKLTLWRRETDVAGKQLLFDAFATADNVAENKAKTNSAAYEVWNVSEQIALNTIEAYLNILRDRRLVAVAKSNVAAHQRTFKLIKRRGEQGISRIADVNQAEGRLETAKASLLAAQGNLDNAKAIYHRYTGLWANKLAEPPVPSAAAIPNNEKLAINLALMNQPELKSAIANVDAAKDKQRSTRALFFPKVDVDVSASLNRNLDGVQGRNNDYMAMMRMQYNLFRGGSDLAQRRQAAFQTEQAFATRNKVQREIVEAMRLAWTDYKTAQSRAPLLKAYTIKAKKTVKAYKKQFQLGKRTLVDVLNAENEVFSSQSSYINTKYALIFDKYRILANMGRTLSFLQIKLPKTAHVTYKTWYTTNYRAVKDYEVLPVPEKDL